uniref:Uncharacterized protein n=1 Tax=Oryza punctata TaxID=4537 RepID=A0A0E0K5Q1_ORYPU
MVIRRSIVNWRKLDLVGAGSSGRVYKAVAEGLVDWSRKLYEANRMSSRADDLQLRVCLKSKPTMPTLSVTKPNSHTTLNHEQSQFPRPAIKL